MRCASESSASRTPAPRSLSGNCTRVFNLRVEHADGRAGQVRIAASVPFDAQHAAGNVHVDGRLGDAAPDRAFLVAVVPRVGVVGTATVSERPALLAVRRAEIESVVVEDEYRGNGIGALLVQAAEAWARRRGCTTVRLLSNVVRERAHRFYGRLGYDVLKTEHVFQKQL